MNPDPFTLRQLLWMAEAKGHDRWAHTSSLMALIANCNRDPKKTPRAFRPADFDPYRQDEERRPDGIPITPDSIGLLKMFVPTGRKSRKKD